MNAPRYYPAQTRDLFASVEEALGPLDIPADKIRLAIDNAAINQSPLISVWGLGKDGDCNALVGPEGSGFRLMYGFPGLMGTKEEVEERLDDAQAQGLHSINLGIEYTPPHPSLRVEN
jgi:hypothetical protein